MFEVHIGCCGFPVAKKTYLEYFKVIEIQSTFYKLPLMQTVQKWREQSPPNFRFTLKAWQGITHLATSPTYRRTKLNWDKQRLSRLGHFQNTKEVFNAWQAMAKIAHILRAKIIVFQCPPNFKQTNEAISRLTHFFQSINRENFTLAIELRANWQPDVVKDFCDQLQLVHCVDPFKEQPLTEGLRYFRLHGAPPGQKMYRYRYSDEDLQKLKQIVQLQPESETYCMFNNMAMLDDALRFKKMFE